WLKTKAFVPPKRECTRYRDTTRIPVVVENVLLCEERQSFTIRWFLSYDFWNIPFRRFGQKTSMIQRQADRRRRRRQREERRWSALLRLRSDKTARWRDKITRPRVARTPAHRCCTLPDRPGSYTARRRRRKRRSWRGACASGRGRPPRNRPPRIVE